MMARSLRPSRRRRPGPAGASDTPVHTPGTRPRRSPRVGPSALPQPRGALLAGAAPILVAGPASVAAARLGELATRLAGAWRWGVQRTLATGPPPILVARGTAAPRQPHDWPPTVRAAR